MQYALYRLVMRTILVIVTLSSLLNDLFIGTLMRNMFTTTTTDTLTDFFIKDFR